MTSPMTAAMTTATTIGTGTPAYALDQSWYAERDRLTSLTALYDEGTVDLAVRLGLGPGWRCADVAAGTGTVARLFAERVGPGGRVLAVDVDTRFLEPLATDVVEVAQADVTVTPLPHGSFDLVHARLLLEHLPVRDRLLRELAAAVRPGGWLLVEDFDWVTAGLVHPPSAVHEKVSGAVRGLQPPRLRRAVRPPAATGDGRRRTSRRGHPHRCPPGRCRPRHRRAAVGAARAAARARDAGGRLVTPADLDAFGALCHDGDTVMFAPLMVSTAGRRPGPDEGLRRG